MMKFEINNESFEINLNNVEIDLELSSFVIRRDFFGLVKDLKFYNDYIIGAVAFEKRKYSLETPFVIPSPVASYFPPGNTNKGCFLTSYLKDSTLNDFQCVPDSNDSYDTQACTLSEINGSPEGKCFNTCMGSSDKSYLRQMYESTTENSHVYSLLTSIKQIELSFNEFIRNKELMGKSPEEQVQYLKSSVENMENSFNEYMDGLKYLF